MIVGGRFHLVNVRVIGSSVDGMIACHPSQGGEHRVVVSRSELHMYPHGNGKCEDMRSGSTRGSHPESEDLDNAPFRIVPCHKHHDNNFLLHAVHTHHPNLFDYHFHDDGHRSNG